jgi:hypothetical protein
MIAPLNYVQYVRLKRKYLELSSFVRSLYNHTDITILNDYRSCAHEFTNLNNRLDKIIIKLDAFEQNELEMK